MEAGQKTLLTVKDAADYLHCSPKTLNMWRGTGNGPPYVKLACVLYDQVDLDKFIESRKRRSTSDPGPSTPVN